MRVEKSIEKTVGFRLYYQFNEELSLLISVMEYLNTNNFILFYFIFLLDDEEVCNTTVT